MGVLFIVTEAHTHEAVVEIVDLRIRLIFPSYGQISLFQ